jgi:hypothetical protein
MFDGRSILWEQPSKLSHEQNTLVTLVNIQKAIENGH